MLGNVGAGESNPPNGAADPPANGLSCEEKFYINGGHWSIFKSLHCRWDIGSPSLFQVLEQLGGYFGPQRPGTEKALNEAASNDLWQARSVPGTAELEKQGGRD